VVRVHRKKFTGRVRAGRDTLDRKSLRIIGILGIFLRLAEGLDRSHAGLVSAARFLRGKSDSVILELEAGEGCDLEVWAVKKHRKAFASVFGKELTIACSEGPGPLTGTGPDG
jgi:exopolyphosphatase/guanosine-5'-triphosphate,3'-diphosphate pyrophosphatase